MSIANRINTNHIIVHIGFQAIGGIVYGFSIYMLLQRGFSSTEAGIFMSIGSLVSMVIQIFLSNYLDHSKNVSVFAVFKGNTIIMVVLFFLNLVLKNKSIYLAF